MEGNNMKNKKRINAEDFAEKFIESEEFELYVDECDDEADFDTNTALRMMLDKADDKGVDLVNVDLFDSDNFFVDAWHITRVDHI